MKGLPQSHFAAVQLRKHYVLAQHRFQILKWLKYYSLLVLPLTSLTSIYLILNLSDLTSFCLEFKQPLMGKYSREKAMQHA